MAKVTRIKAQDHGREDDAKEAKVTARVKSGETKTSVRKEDARGDVSVDAQARRDKNNASARARRKADRAKLREEKKKAREEKRKNESTAKKIALFIPRAIAKPFAAIGRYVHNSWMELRQVRWPSRKASWKMFLALLIYCAIIIVVVMALDTLFTWLFNLILGS